MTHSILILGGGNMGGAIARILHAQGIFSVNVVESVASRRDALAALGIPVYASLDQAAPADILMLAIKPQQFSETLEVIKEIAKNAPLLVSIMAGVPLASLHAISSRAVRVMPNLPALIGESMSVACAPGLPKTDRVIVNQLLESIGAVEWVEDENQLHAITAISGSGPGYIFAFMEALEKASLALGLNRELAKKLVRQTLRGAALLADTSAEEMATLRANVTSKGGTTEAALRIFEDQKGMEILSAMVEAAIKRSKQLSQ